MASDDNNMPDGSPNDRKVIEIVLAGDRQRYAILVRRYHGPLLHLATSRLGNQAEAEDAVQDAFVAAFRSLHTYKPEYSFRTWLWTILLNQCRRHGTRMAKHPRQIELEHEIHQDGTADDSPERIAMLIERNRLLNDLLLQLPEERADAIRLRFFGQLKFREVAEVMGSSLNGAKQRVRLGLVTLGDMLRDRKLTDSVFPEDKQ